jgi:AAA domain, putative AbiEii toxin, Type IV TA system/AAA domain
MYESFRVKNYRCFDDLTIEPLARVNLIAGKNNVGKTALLEAVWLHHEYHNPTVAYWVNAWRGLQRIKATEFLWEVFRNFDPRAEITLAARNSVNSQSNVTIVLPPQRTGAGFADTAPSAKVGESQRVTQTTEAVVEFRYDDGSANPQVYLAMLAADGGVINAQPAHEPSSFFLPAHQAETNEWLAERFSDLAAKQEERQVLKILKIIEPRLNDLRVLLRAGAPMIYGDLERAGRLPLPSLGDGMRRLLRISIGMQFSKGGLLAVDEVENGFHYSVMKNVWNAIAIAARDLDAQLFATTHSEECIRSAHEAFSESENYDFRLHRLDYVDSTIKAITYDQEALEFALTSGWEVR